MFRRKKEIEDEDELTQRTVKVKDLKRENRRKRELPPKPWGKKERFLVLFILLSSIIGSIALAFSSRHGKLPGLPRIAAPDLGLSQTVILENTTPSPVQKKKQEVILSAFRDEVQSLSGIYALVVVDLTKGDSFGVNENEVMQAASLIKLPVMVSAYIEYEAGRFALDTKYTLKDSDKIGGSGSIQYKPAGTVYTYRQLLSYMGQQSDNTAFNIVRRKLTDTVIDKHMNDFGLRNTSLDENMTTPSEVALLFKKLYDGSLITSKNRDELLGFMTKTIYEEHLAKGIPDGIQVAHKYGREVHVVNDGGVVFADTPYVVVIMTDGVIEAEADKIFPDLSRLVYEGMQN